MPDFRGMQALNAWLLGHDRGLLLQGPDPDAPHPVMHGVVVRQSPQPHTLLDRWDPVTVWVEIPEDGSGVREPRTPPPDLRVRRAARDEP
ncbi:hypothetical protein [Actinophytocola gossypii]|uniref:PASTA domain-containing protein n=1 Tax=Actinophytocola gossypii TaxID=2812003 RepID=A0ABT2JGG6_9PSEU|nr:hypothetical protein [Actinophytocola gossypii]MCT2586970.1 PASTA domain-containing protein [Actinophytocola gossypii]